MNSSAMQSSDKSNGQKRTRTTLMGAASVQQDDQGELLNASLQLAWNDVMHEDGHYMTAPFYKTVKCLLISWDNDDLHTEKEVCTAQAYR